MLLRLDELDSRTCSIQQPPPQKPIPATPADGLEGDEEEEDPIPGFPAKSPGHAALIDPRDWIDYLPRAYAESMPPVGLTNPGLWNPRNDEWDCYLTDEKKQSTRGEYRHMLCYGVYTAAAHAALTDAVATLRAKNAIARDTADANDLLDSAIRTIATCGQAVEDRLTYLRRFKCKKALTGEERVAERLVYSRFFDTTAAERSCNGVDGLLNALDDKRLEEGVRIPFKHNRPPPNFHNGISMQDATPAQLTFLVGELARFVESGAWEFGTCRKWVSRLFLVPKPGVNQWRCIIDLRVLNSYCVRKRLKMEILLGVRHLTKKGDYMFSFDLQDGFYALGIAEADRDYFTMDVRGRLYMLASLPMGWSLSPYYFVTHTQVFIAHLRKPEPEPPSSSTQPTRSKRYLRRTRWRGARNLPYVDDFLLFSASMEQALHLRQRLASLLDALGLQRNPTKGFLEPCQFGRHLGVDIDSASGMFYAPADKLKRLSRQATRLTGHATRNARWLSVRELQSLAWQAQYLFVAIPAARFFLRELHSVVGDRWGGRVGMTPQLRRDLQWWTSVPNQSNSKPIHRPVETAYLHTDSSSYGWGGVLNGRLEARGFWSSADECQHITWKELKAVRLAVESFLPDLAGGNVLLHENNKAAYHVLSGLTSRSPEMMAELRRLWCLLDSHGIHMRARYIRSTANIWADRLRRHLDSDDWQLDPLLFAERESRFGPHSIDRFASALNTLLPRYNAAWLDPTCEAVDSLHLPDADRRRENNLCNAPWPLLPDLVQKLQQSGAAATVVAPRWEGKAWHQALTKMAVEELTARYVTGLGNLGTIKASSLQPYLSAVNHFFKDHGREPMALGNLVSRARKGLAVWQGATTAAYVIGVTMQKIKYFGGWAMESGVVLDYIDPTVMPCHAAWHLFG
eukprot:jgi/Tetstr1/458350/TSEL_044789.t1